MNATPFTLSLSASAVIDIILAESAMRHFMRPDRPEPLTPDRRTALLPLVRGAWGQIMASISTAVTDTAVSPDGDTLTCTLTGDPSQAPALLAALERLTALQVMAPVYAACGQTAAADSLTRACAALRSRLAATSLPLPTATAITPSPL